MVNRAHISQLFEKYLGNECSKHEIKELLEYFMLSDEEEYLKILIENELNSKVDLSEYTSDIQEVDSVVWNLLSKNIRPIRRINFLKLFAVVAAAAALLFFVFKWSHDPGNELKEQQTLAIESKEKATLTLADKQEILLNDQRGIITKDGLISYQGGEEIIHSAQVQNLLLTTERAAQYHAILPDGTKVWLNASSSIRYPSHFSGKERLVDVTGEVYFEVAKNPDMPFKVISGQQEIEVLGTEFNLNAYGDNDGQILTTLSEGSLRVKALTHEHEALLKPGEQAVFSTQKNIQVHQVNVQEVNAWKEGLFIIENRTLSQYAQHLERWYDIEVNMNGFGEIKLSAIIPRRASLVEVLEAITLKTGVKFKIQGRRVNAVK